jgi:hypothetical protein
MFSATCFQECTPSSKPTCAVGFFSERAFKDFSMLASFFSVAIEVLV